ncbi:MAG: type II toxin-antitoxin system RelE/ParE family toxin [Rhodospirillaceae bacterium]|nr:MAG: type II toxin-antitoxin system RelE/ParE family toxin [Rhodospirillaceae bacterium]
MARVTRTPRAGADLDEIWLRVALDNPAAADRLIDRLVGQCRDLADHPHLGTARPEVAPEARMLIVDDYVVLHRVDGTNVEIVRVVHGARRLQDVFDDEPEA